MEREEGRAISSRGTWRGLSHFCSKQAGLHLPTPFSTAPQPKACLAQTLPLGPVHAVQQGSLTLTVSSGRQVAAASFPRATESGYCPRWNSAEMEAHTARTQGAGQGLAPPQQHLLPAPTPPGTTLNCPPPGGRATCSLQRSAMAHIHPAPAPFSSASAWPGEKIVRFRWPGPGWGPRGASESLGGVRGIGPKPAAKGDRSGSGFATAIPPGLWVRGSVAKERNRAAGTSTSTRGLLQGHWVRCTLHTVVGACLVF